MVRSTQINDISQLKDIWKTVFGDEDQYINNFFSSIFTPENSWCYEDEGNIGAMLYTIPCRIRIKRYEWTDASYFYALATRERLRRRGIMGNLIETAQNELEKRGCNVMFLIPAEKHLIDYYKKYGFRTLCAIDGYYINDDIDLEEISPLQMSDLIEKDWKYTSVNIVFDKKVHLFYLEDLITMPENKLYCIKDKEKQTDGFLICRKTDKGLEIMQYGTNDIRVASHCFLNTEEENNAKEIAIKNGNNCALLNGLIPV